MARVCEDGAEFKDILFWTYAGSSEIKTAIKRSGEAAYGISHYSGYYFKTIPDQSEYYFRWSVYFDFEGAGLYSYPLVVYHDYPTTCLISLNYDFNTKKVSAYTGYGSSLLTTGTCILDTYVHHLLECYIKIDDNPNGRIITYWDGIKDIDFTGDTKPGADTTINAFGVGGGYGGYLIIDDIAVNNTSGLVDNSWCGDEHYELHPANDNGDVNNWTGSDGDKVNNYALVDEIPPTGDTDYVKSDTPSEQDMYKITSFTDTGKIVTRLWAECRARDSNASAGEIKIGFKTGGSVYLCSTDRVLPSNYARVVGDEALVNPADSGIWEKADIDALQFVTEAE